MVLKLGQIWVASPDTLRFWIWSWLPINSVPKLKAYLGTYIIFHSVCGSAYVQHYQIQTSPPDIRPAYSQFCGHAKAKDQRTVAKPQNSQVDTTPKRWMPEDMEIHISRDLISKGAVNIHGNCRASLLYCILLLYSHFRAL